jgi:hypothetical protein
MVPAITRHCVLIYTYAVARVPVQHINVFFIIITSYWTDSHLAVRTTVMLSVPTNDYARCQCCNASFQRLSSHPSWNEFCSTYYKNMPLDRGNGGLVDDVHARGVAHFNQAGATAGTRKSTRIHGRASTLGDVVGDNIPVDQPIPDDDDDAFAMSDGDDAFPPCNEDEDVPDGIILELYQEMQDLQSNRHGFDRFSCEEKVHIKLLHLLKKLKAPLKAFSSILQWAGKANEQGCIFRPQCQPSRTRVIHNLYCRYNMKGLIPKEKEFFLPYSRRIVTMFYFNAREVFAS